MKAIKLPAIILLATIIFGCSQDNYPQPKTDSVYGSRALDNSWPELEKQASDTEENLTADNYYILIGNTQSMQKSQCISSGRSKLAIAKKALSAFVEKVPSTAKVGVASFDGQGAKEYAALEFNHADRIFSAMRPIPPVGSVALGDGVRLSYNALKSAAKQQLGYGSYNFILVTDDKTSVKNGLMQAIDVMLNDSSIAVHILSICGSQDHPLNKPGASYHPIYQQDALTSTLNDAIEKVLVEAPAFKKI